MADVFVSYARKEKDRAVEIRRSLEGLGLSTFFDVEGLDAGDPWPDRLDAELKTAGAVVSLWSPHALSRQWVRNECAVGEKRGVLLPAELEPVTDYDVPAQFATLQRVDLSDFHGQSDHAGWRSLVRALARKLKRKDLLVVQIATLTDASQTTHIKLELEEARRELARLRRDEMLLPFLAAFVFLLALAGGVFGYVELERQKAVAAREVRASLASPELIKLLESECASGEALKCHNVGLMLLQGAGGAKDIPKGLELITTACNGGVGKACADLAAFYLNGVQVPQSDVRAQSLYKQACENHHALSCMKIRQPGAGPTVRE